MTKRFPARLALFACILLTFMATQNPTIAQTGDLTIVKLPAAWKLQLAWQLPRPDATLKGLINTAKTAMDLLALPQTSKSGWSDYVAGQGYGWERQGFANPCGLGVLRQAIRLPEELARRSHLYLVLPGVDEDCWVYLNGELVFEQSQKTTGLTPDDLWNYPLVCEITGKIASDAETLLALGILNRAGMGGLYTDAFLVGADCELTAGEAVTSLPEDNPYGYSVAFMRKFGPADKTGKLKEAILDSWTPYRKSVLEKRAGYEVTVMRYGDHLQQEIYLSVPRSRPNGPCPVVVWYHGGGLTIDGPGTPQQLFNGLLAVAEVRYRISGVEFTALDSLEDSAASLAFLLDHITEYGGDAKKVFIGGISAGGWLSAMIGMNPNLLAKYGHSFRELRGLILVTGQMTTHFQLKNDLKYDRRENIPVIDEYAPIYWISKEVPPLVCITGSEGYDWPGRPAENEYMVQMLKVFGHPDATHVVLDGFTHAATGDFCGYSTLQFVQRILEK